MAVERNTIFKPKTAGDPKLAVSVRGLVGAYQPGCVYFFGSVAPGYKAGPDSDYDLLVVVPERRVCAAVVLPSAHCLHRARYRSS